MDIGINLYNESAADVPEASSRRLQDQVEVGGNLTGGQLYLASLGMTAEEAFVNSVVLQICIIVGLVILHLLLLEIVCALGSRLELRSADVLSSTQVYECACACRVA